MTRTKPGIKAGGTVKTPATDYRRILDGIVEGCQLIGFDWRYLYLNDVAARQDHRDKKQLLGRTVMECYPGIEKAKLFAKLRASMDKRIPATITDDFVFPGGTRGRFELRISPVPEGIMIFSTDISKRKKAKDALAEAEQRFRLVTESVTDVIWTVDMNMRPTYISRPFLGCWAIVQKKPWR